MIDINAKKNQIVVGDKKLLNVEKIYLKNLNIFNKIELLNKNIFIKVRSTGRLIKAKVSLNNYGAEVKLLEDETGISPGQACVFYLKNATGDKVLGGGWIDRTDNKYLSTQFS